MSGPFLLCRLIVYQGKSYRVRLVVYAADMAEAYNLLNLGGAGSQMPLHSHVVPKGECDAVRPYPKRTEQNLLDVSLAASSGASCVCTCHR